MPSGDPSLTTTVISAIWVMFAISSIFTTLRLYCRFSHSGSIWWDDYLLGAGWVVLLTGVCLQTAIFKAGYLVTAFTDPFIGPRNLASDGCMKVALALVKTSFSLTVIRIAVGWPRWVVYICIAVVNLTCFVHTVLVWRANCGTEEAWAFKPCWDRNSGVWMGLIGGVISAATDFILTLVPLTIIWGLQMKKIEKIGVALAMSVGLFAGIISAVKAAESYNVVTVVGTAFSYRLATLSIWIHAEPNAAIVASCIPVLRIFFRDVARSYGGYGRSGDKGGKYLKSTTKSTFHGDSTATATAVAAAKPDDDSETSILNDDTKDAPKGHRIHQTRQVTVEYNGNAADAENRHNWEQADAIEMGNYGRAK
ncbi:hypothetical protein QBC37DRAFT_288319 [Rhypophila decipiens]|uniref:Rhodopsin domain-containing protein n=1 Tax=Rhypophila decipiens TaxID=261697 RepID=A0AAN6Y4Z8_9PEZI|nr:hypothetical protein QBC37DRAFT_288319 [Rhypophila decipiens]